VEDDPPFYLARRSASAASSAGSSAVVQPLARAYEYSVELCLRLPESPPNVETGTFVASIRIVSASNATLLAVARPLVLRYRSEQLQRMRGWFYALPLLLGWMEEAQTLCVPLAESFTNLRHEPAHRATVALTSPGACGLQVYAASLTFGVRLTGLTRAMSHYFFASAALGVGSLMVLHWLALLLFELRPTDDTAAPPQRAPPAASDATAAGSVAYADAARREAEASVRRRRAADVRAADAAARGTFLDAAPDEYEPEDDASFVRTGDLHDGLRQDRSR
jgi:hypothetical protein